MKTFISLSDTVGVVITYHEKARQDKDFDSYKNLCGRSTNLLSDDEKQFIKDCRTNEKPVGLYCSINTLKFIPLESNPQPSMTFNMTGQEFFELNTFIAELKKTVAQKTISLNELIMEWES